MIRGTFAALGGAALFAVAVLESGRGPSAVEPSAPTEAIAGVRQFLTILHHFQSSGGNPRFAERLPAEPSLVAEIRGSVEWERHLDEQTDLEPVRVEIVSATGRDAVAIVRTRELAIAHTRRRSGSPDARETKRGVVEAWEYRVVHSATGWRVADWKPLPAREGDR